MPDSRDETSSTPVAPLDAAQGLEDAADWLLVNGRCRDTLTDESGAGCVIQAIAQAVNPADDMVAGWRRENHVYRLFAKHSIDRFGRTPVSWNRDIVDDFEVIDELRLAAKDLRNTAAAG
jgi:hypothetical protein